MTWLDRYGRLLISLGVGVVLLVAVQLILAQEAPDPAPSTAPAEPTATPAAEAQADEAEALETQADEARVTAAKKPPDDLLGLIVAGGPVNIGFMVFLGLFSLVAAAVALERFVNLRRGKMLPRAFVRDLQELVRREETRPEKYRELAKSTSAPIANILNGGLQRAGRPLPEIEKSMEDTAAREMATLRSRVRPLSVIANVAPLVGLLGTVVGMLEAFRVASQAGLGKAELLAEGIYLALETTVAGLIIAIPALLAAAYFSGRSERFMRDTDELLMEAIPALGRLEHPASGHAPNTRPATSNPLLTTAR